MTIIDLALEEVVGKVLPGLLLFGDVLGSVSVSVLLVFRNFLFSAALLAVYQQLPYQQNKPPLQHPLSMPMRHSGLQKDVLKLYRDLHRAARKKDPNDVDHFTSFGAYHTERSSSFRQNYHRNL